MHSHLLLPALTLPLPCCPVGAGAYLLGVMPPELLQLLSLDLPLRRRDPHYFLPSPAGGAGKHLLLGGDEEASRAQFRRFFSEVCACL